MKRIFLIFVFLLILILPQIAHGVSLIDPLGCEGVSGTECLIRLFEKIINFLFYLAIVLAPLMILIAAFLFLTSAGDLKRIQQAKSMITWTIIGFTVILLSKGLIIVIRGILGG